MPLNMHEVQDVSQRGHGLRHGRDRADFRGLSPLMRSSPSSVCSLSANTVLYGNGAGEDIEEDYIDLQICNSCGQVCFPARLYTSTTILTYAFSRTLLTSGTNALTAPPNLHYTTWYVTIFY